MSTTRSSARKPKPKKPYRYPGWLRYTAPRSTDCPRCRAPVLTALHDSLVVALDPQPLIQLGELEALLLRLRTFLYVDPHLYRRHAMAIDSEPAPRWGDVLREHRCGFMPTESGVKRAPISDPNEEPGF